MKKNTSRKVFAATASAALIASAVAPTAIFAADKETQVFPDVPATHQYAGVIKDLSAAGIVKGMPSGNFEMGATVTRAQASLMLANILKLDTDNAPKTDFADVKEDVWYTGAINALHAAGHIKGLDAETFAPDKKLTRAEFVQLVTEAYGIQTEEVNLPFTDLAAGNDVWYKAPLKALYANDLINGVTTTTFAPAAEVKRGDFAWLLANVDYKFGNTLPKPGVESEVEGVESVSAINNTTVEVTFKEEVADVKALDFAIEGLTVANAVVKQTDKKVVVITTSAQEGDKQYTLTNKGEVLGSFKGISNVIPTKVDVATKSLQGKLGQEITVSAKVDVPEGQSKAGIAVTFNVPGHDGSLNPKVTGEALTDSNGVATYSYTRYSAVTDEVVAYATGDRSKFSIGFVHWGVDTLLTVEAVNEDSVVNNGSNKTYKLVARNAKDGKLEANQTFHVSLAENINVTADKLTDATVNGETPMQLSNATVGKTVVVTTNSKGEATFTVSGKNTSATPIVFKQTLNDKNLHSEEVLQVTGEKVTFKAIQAAYDIAVKGELTEVAALGHWSTGGRSYTITVKDKDGKVAKNELVNVAFNEDLDRVLSTNTNAKFQTADKDGKTIVDTVIDQKHIKVKTNDKGEAKFTIYSNEAKNDYATPIVWIDLDSSDANKSGILDKDEPFGLGEITLFEAAKLQSAKLTVDATDNTVTTGNPLPFLFTATNQSGKEYSRYSVEYVDYTVYNTGANDVQVGNTKISPNRSATVTLTNNNPLLVTSNGKVASVEVTATAKVTDHVTGESHIFYTNVEKGKVVKYSTNVVTGTATTAGTDELVIDGSLYSYAGAAYQYGGSSITKAKFNEYIAGNDAVVSVSKDADDKLTFNVIDSATTSPADLITKTEVTDANQITVTFSYNVSPASPTKPQFAIDFNKDGVISSDEYATGATVSGTSKDLVLTFDAKHKLNQAETVTVPNLVYTPSLSDPTKNLVVGGETLVGFNVSVTVPAVAHGVTIDGSTSATSGSSPVALAAKLTVATGQVTKAGNLNVTLTASKSKISTVTVPVAVTLLDDEKVVATKIAAALNALVPLTEKFTVTADGADVLVVAKEKVTEVVGGLVVGITADNAEGAPTVNTTGTITAGNAGGYAVTNAKFTAVTATANLKPVTVNVYSNGSVLVDKAIKVNVSAGDTAADVATKVAAALNADTTITSVYTVTVVSDEVTLTNKVIGNYTTVITLK